MRKSGTKGIRDTSSALKVSESARNKGTDKYGKNLEHSIQIQYLRCVAIETPPLEFTEKTHNKHKLFVA